MIVNIKNKTNLSSFYVVFNNTVVNEHPNLHGISHLIEHIMCRSMFYILDELESHGIEWNAYTSSEHINFFMVGLDEYIKEYKHIFLNNLLNINITEDIFIKEKNIVLQEYNDSFNSQSFRHFYNMYRKYFNFYHIIGNKKNITELTIDDCINYYNENYSVPSKIYNISKNNKYNKKIKLNDNQKELILKRDIYNNDLEIHKPSTDYSSLIYMSDIITKDFGKIKFINMMLSKGLNSPLLKEIRGDKSNVYYFTIELEKITPNCGVINLFTESSKNKINDITKNIEKIINNKHKYITKERFDIIKKYLHIYYKKLDINKHININSYIIPKEWRIKTILNDLTFDEVYELYDKYYNLDTYIRSVDSEDFI